MLILILLINTITYHKIIKIKPIDVKSDSYAEYNVDSNEIDPKFKIYNFKVKKHFC